MSAYEMELEWAIESQVDALRGVLQEFQLQENMVDCMLRTKFSSAPQNDSLFDSISLCVKVESDGSAHLRGTLTGSDGSTKYGYIIKSFPSFIELVHWYNESGDVYNTCKERFHRKSDVIF